MTKVGCYIVVRANDGRFLGLSGSWWAEYPEAAHYPSIRAARNAVRRFVTESCHVYLAAEYGAAAGIPCATIQEKST